MTLAVFLLIAASWTVSPQSPQATAAAQSETETNTPAPEKQSQTPSHTPANNPEESTPQASAGTPQKAPAVKRPLHKKKATQRNCDAAPAPSGTANTAGSGSTTPPDPAAPNTATTTSKNCPPTKIIVRHGGTSEPSIQLAPSTDQAAGQRDVIKQLLGATDANLKRIAGKTLNPSQQATLGQIRDYEQQSRGAISDGDLERARTLAWKAELLSEDLTKPQK